MTQQPRPKQKTEKQEKPRVEALELNRETLHELTDGEADEVKGGVAGVGRVTYHCDTEVGCETQMDCGRVPS